MLQEILKFFTQKKYDIKYELDSAQKDIMKSGNA